MPKPTPPSTAPLFAEAHAAPPPGVYTARIDGASRGNPGPAAYAMILRGPEGAKVAEISRCIGRKTNNMAEYYALVAALDYAASQQIRALRVESDSELLVRQMQGRYKVRNSELRPLHERAAKLARGLDYFVIAHIPREENSEADALANRALDGSPALERAAPAAPVKVRARYLGGLFLPAGAPEIPEGAEVDLEVRILKAR